MSTTDPSSTSQALASSTIYAIAAAAVIVLVLIIVSIVVVLILVRWHLNKPVAPASDMVNLDKQADVETAKGVGKGVGGGEDVHELQKK